MSVRTKVSSDIAAHLRYRWSLEQISTYVALESRGARSIVENTRGARAFWVAKGGMIDSSRLSSYCFEQCADVIGVHAVEPSEQIAGDFQAGPERERIARPESERLARVLAPAVVEALDVGVFERIAALAGASSNGHIVGVSGAETAAKVITQRGGTPVVLAWSGARLPEDTVDACDMARTVDVCDMVRRPLDWVDDLQTSSLRPGVGYVFARESLHVTEWGDVYTKEWDGHPEREWHVAASLELGAMLTEEAVCFDLTGAS